MILREREPNSFIMLLLSFLFLLFLLVTKVSSVPKHRLMVESIYDIDMVKMTKAMKKKKRHQRRQERRGVTPSPPSRHSGNNLLSAFSKFRHYQLPSQLRQQTQVVVKPTKGDIASHDLDEIRQMLLYCSTSSSVDSYANTITPQTNHVGTTSYSYHNNSETENVDENTMHTLMEQHFISKQQHQQQQSYSKTATSSPAAAQQHTTPPPSGKTNLTITNNDKVVNMGHSSPPHSTTTTTKTWKRYTAPSWPQTTESSPSSSSSLSSSVKNTWWKNYKALQKFYNNHGHYVVPPDYDDDNGSNSDLSDNGSTLFEWAARQRQINREITHGYRQPTIQETEQMKLLKTINFPMELDSILPRRPNNKKSKTTSTSTIGQQGKRKFQELEEETIPIDVLFGDEPNWGNANEDAILFV